MTNPTVLFSTLPSSAGLFIGHAILNAEASLNALMQETVHALNTQLLKWANDDSIACVVISGAGSRAFCAGGDVRSLRSAVLSEGWEGDWHPYAVEFLADEYRMDYRIATYPKPVLVWAHGFVLGGGMGITQAASHRIVSEHSQLAMPEVSIGFFPDVAGSAFLSQLPRWAGHFLALTGAAINASDALALNLADFALPHDALPVLLSNLSTERWETEPSERHSQLDELLSRLGRQHAPILPAPELIPAKARLVELFEADSLAQLPERWQQASALPAWLEKALATARAGCPVSHIVGIKMQEWAQDKSLADVFRKELSLAVRMVHQLDFAEGVRAQLVDRDRTPHWQWANLADVPDAYITALFSSAWPVNEHPLRDLGQRTE